jgi:hypothetical protein
MSYETVLPSAPRPRRSLDRLLSQQRMVKRQSVSHKIIRSTDPPHRTNEAFIHLQSTHEARESHPQRLHVPQVLVYRESRLQLQHHDLRLCYVEVLCIKSRWRGVHEARGTSQCRYLVDPLSPECSRRWRQAPSREVREGDGARGAGPDKSSYPPAALAEPPARPDVLELLPLSGRRSLHKVASKAHLPTDATSVIKQNTHSCERVYCMPSTVDDSTNTKVFGE